MLASSSSRASGWNSETQKAFFSLAILFDSQAVKSRVWSIEANVTFLVLEERSESEVLQLTAVRDL